MHVWMIRCRLRQKWHYLAGYDNQLGSFTHGFKTRREAREHARKLRRHVTEATVFKVKLPD